MAEPGGFYLVYNCSEPSTAIEVARILSPGRGAHLYRTEDDKESHEIKDLHPMSDPYILGEVSVVVEEDELVVRPS